MSFEVLLPSCDISDNSIATTNTTKSSDIDVDLEDGPLFRATIKEYESKTLVLKGYLKRILKSASASLEAKTLVLEQDKLFIEALKEAPFSEPLFSHYLDFTWQKLYEQQERLLFCMQSLLIHPLQKLYDMDIKTVDTKKRQFEDVSKDYYTNLAKYLSIKTPTHNKKQKKTESEFLFKKREFDLIRFDYYTFLRDLHGGKKEQEILYHLLALYEKQFSFFHNVNKTLEPHKHGLDELAIMIAEASREQKMLNQERDEKRKILVSKCVENDVDNKRKSFSPNSRFTSPESPMPTTLDEATSSIGLGISLDTNKFKGIRDLEQQDEDYKNKIGRRKEGFLFATSKKPTKNNNHHHHHHNTPSFDMSATVNWHKYWCVLSGGQLHEYSNWKRHLETHIEPINLRFATVREARNSERRFCFEVITPNFKRMYQATSNEELSSWMATINNAICSLLNGMGSFVNLKKNEVALSPNWRKHQSRSISGALSGLTAAAKDKYLPKKKRHGGSIDSFSSSPYHPPTVTTTTTPQSTTTTTSQQSNDLLVQLRKDVSNTICADCSAKNPDWCSLNLGILICIECSGIHRSLGTHISKVRSLTLDSASFTPDIIQLLLSIGNAKSNTIWEGVGSNKPIPSDTRETKLKYIQLKYVDKSLIKQHSVDAMKVLYEAIQSNDISQALYAIALGADVNQPFPTDLLNPPISLLLPPPPCLVLKLPILDIDGNEYLDKRTMQVNLPPENFIVRYALHFALLSHQDITPSNPVSGHSTTDDDDDSVVSSNSSSRCTSSQCSMTTQQRVFPMAEFLFQNGADAFIIDTTTNRLLADLVGLGSLVDDEAITFLNMKNSLRGQTAIIRSHVIPAPIISSPTSSSSS